MYILNHIVSQNIVVFWKKKIRRVLGSVKLRQIMVGGMCLGYNEKFKLPGQKGVHGRQSYSFSKTKESTNGQ